MIHQWIHRRPRGTNMAGPADIGGINVCCALARGGGAFVTRSASTCDLRMINTQRRRPYISGMAGFTQLAGRNMSGTFTRRRTAIVTTAATVHYSGVAENGT